MKVSYYEYTIRYKHRDYRILVPQSLPDEMYLCCNYCKNSDSDYIDGDRYTFRSLRDAAVTLALIPDVIIFYPVGRRKSIYAIPNEEVQDARGYDLVLYNHQIQLSLSGWKRIRKMLQYVKKSPLYLKFNIPEMICTAQEKLEKYEKSKQYYYSKSRTQVRFTSGTCFVESNKILQFNAFLRFEKFLQNDIEKISGEQKYSTLCFPYEGIECGFVTREYKKIWDEYWNRIFKGINEKKQETI